MNEVARPNLARAGEPFDRLRESVRERARPREASEKLLIGRALQKPF